MVKRGCDMNDLQNVNMPLGFREEIRIKVHVQCDEDSKYHFKMR